MTEVIDNANQKLQQEDEKRKKEIAEADRQRQEIDKTREEVLEKLKEAAQPPQGPTQTSKTESDIRREQDINAREAKRGRNATPEEVLTKVNEAWKAIPDVVVAEDDEYDSYDKPEGIKFVTARLLSNGGVILEINTFYGTHFLKHPAVRRHFQKTLGKDVSIKDRQYSILVEFLPITLQQRLADMATIIEEDNFYTKGDIHQIRWMRDPENSWRKDQQYAHAVLNTRDRNRANDIIEHGIVIAGKRYKARKLEDDPKRCYKCQLIEPGHRAADCPNEEERNGATTRQRTNNKANTAPRRLLQTHTRATVHTTYTNAEPTTTKPNDNQQANTNCDNEKISIQGEIDKRKKHNTKNRPGTRTKQDITDTTSDTVCMGKR
ncbi:hypothetical protein HYPSUDRAFT_209846 [Hypholoma sublateritium FD-334 SS-4]|uniref:CCHC-type domain-containing protein n=1 Tax=Hypholoma sublateritium (strain FD-334 SS-4) TaxID=945553 RepID=A0A0D2LQJ0_HYPSF|nr:hypothetical protein HYPSUDRAFT_209846 [Hypholoma sublateritium FD-334 SS-4]